MPPSPLPPRPRTARVVASALWLGAALLMALGGSILWPELAADRRAGAAPGETYVLAATWPLPVAPAEPVDVALGPGGELYVADGRHNTVMAYDGAGHLRDTWRQTGDQEAYVPVALAVDAAHDLVHVLWQRYRDAKNGSFTPAGLFLDTRQPDGVAVRPLQALTFLSAAVDMAVHEASGHLWITGAGKIHHVRPGPVPGPAIDVGDTRGAAGRLAVRPDETIALVRPAEGTVALYAEAGIPAGTLDLDGHTPVAVAADAAGQLHVLVQGGDPVDPGAPVVMTFDASGEHVRSWSGGGSSAPPVPASAWPWAIAAAADGLALVTAGTRFHVLWYDADGRPRGRLQGAPVRESYTPRFSAAIGRAPFALAGAGDGTLYAYDGRSANLVRFTDEGAPILVAAAPEDTIDVAVAGAHAYATTLDGRVLALPVGPGEDGTGPTWDARCDCDLGGRIAAGPGVVYVSRPRDQAVATFNAADGLRLRTFRLSESVGLWPSDVVVAPDGRLYTGDLVTAQVQGWQRADVPELVWQAGLLAGPRRLAAGRAGEQAVIGAVMADGFVELHAAADGNLLARWRPELDDGKPFDIADIALGPAGEVALADAGARAVRVFVPGAGVPATPVPDPSATPTPSQLSCVVRGDKVARPSTVVLGQTAAITLTLAAHCPSSTRIVGADIMLVMDRSGSMSGAKLAAARGAAQAFAELLDVRYHQLGVVSFSDDATVDVPLTTRIAAVVDGLNRLEPAGETNIAAALEAALRHLQGFGRAEALPVIVLLTDGQYSGGTADPRVVAAEARNWGARIFTIGLGDDAVADVLETIAGDPGRYFFAPTPSELYPIYSQILRLVLASLAGNWIIDDELAPDLRYVDGSAIPAALVGSNHLRWGRSILPATGITLTYAVHPELPGCQATNRQAVADYTDADGVPRRYVFPVPTVCVVTPTPTPTDTPTPTATPTPAPRPIFLPLAARCLSAAQHADVVLLIDTSDSMSGAKLDAAKQAAATFIRLLELPRDQAAVVGFNSAPQVASRLTGDRAALENAVASLANGAGTRIDAALNAGLGELLGARHRPQNRQVMVLLSDGAHNGDRADVVDGAAAARRLGIVIYAIGLGSDVDRTLLSSVAGPGRTYFAPTAGDLEAIYREIAAAIPCR